MERGVKRKESRKQKAESDGRREKETSSRSRDIRK